MRKLLLTALISIFSAPVSAQSGTHTMFIEGFRTFVAGEYVASEKNLAVLRAIKYQMPKIRIADFGADDPNMATLVCRMSWPLYAPAKLPYAMFLAGAMRDELTREGLYASNDGIAVTGRLDSINFDSFGSGKWQIVATFSVEGKTPVTVKHETVFPVAFGAASACRSVRDNLVPAMQEFLFAVYSDPQFQAMLH